MFNQTQAFREYLHRREVAIVSEKSNERPASDLFNDKTFYRKFTDDLSSAKKEVIIYSPFVTKFRTDFYKPIIEKLRERNIEIFIFTRPLEEYDSIFRPQIEYALNNFEKQGVCIFYLGKYIHEKVAIIDREILWEGSLNILSHRASREMMRRTPCEQSAMQVLSYLSLDKKLAEGYKLIYERLCHNLKDNAKNISRSKIRIFFLGLAIPIVTLLVIFFLKEISPLFRWVSMILKFFGA